MSPTMPPAGGISSDADDVEVTLPSHPFARAFRCAVVGMTFGTVFGVLTPLSPILRRTFAEDKKGYRFVFMAASTSLMGAMVPYARWVDFGKTDPSFAPWMTPWHALVPGFGAYLMTHLTFPGVFILTHEKTWKIARYEYVRMTLKVLVAYYRVHLPAAAVASAIIGLILYPLNMRKSSWSEAEAKAELRRQHLENSSPLMLR